MVPVERNIGHFVLMFVQIIEALTLTPEELSRLFHQDLLYFMVKQEEREGHVLELDCRAFTNWKEHDKFSKKPNWFFSRIANKYIIANERPPVLQLIG